MPTETETGAEAPATPREVFEKQAADFLNAGFEAPAPVITDFVPAVGETVPLQENPTVIGFARTEPLHKPELIAAAIEKEKE